MWDAGASTRSMLIIPEARRGLKGNLFLLALAPLLNSSLKHTVKSFSTQLYNAAFRGQRPLLERARPAGRFTPRPALHPARDAQTSPKTAKMSLGWDRASGHPLRGER